jgi:CRP-like cAMP-binding protein
MLAIKALPLFTDMHLDELAVVAEHAAPRTFAAGEVLPPSIHLIVEGRVTEHREGLPFRTHGPHHVVGGVDALATADAAVTFVAEEPTSTLTIEHGDLRDILEDNFGVLSGTLEGVAASTLRLRRELIPSAGFRPQRSGEERVPESLDDLGARIVFLRAHPALRLGRIETLGMLAREATLVSLADRDRLWRSGEPADHAVLVVHGRLECATEDGRQRFDAGARAILGLDEALAIQPRWYGATARGPATLLRITRTAILDALEDDPDTALHMLAALADIARELRDQAARGMTEDA